MLTFPCPWCDHELVVSAQAEAVSQVRCDGCATVMDLAPAAAERADPLPLAA
ncbi:MAG: hypothetical protein ABWZ82_02185 [Candidatus Limnocylindrales bacterium]